MPKDAASELRRVNAELTATRRKLNRAKREAMPVDAQLHAKALDALHAGMLFRAIFAFAKAHLVSATMSRATEEDDWSYLLTFAPGNHVNHILCLHSNRQNYVHEWAPKVGHWMSLGSSEVCEGVLKILPLIRGTNWLEGL